MAVTAPTGHRASLHVDESPLRSPLRLRQRRTSPTYEHASKHDTSLERSGNHLAAMQQHKTRRQSPDNFLHNSHSTTQHSHRWVSWSTHHQPTMFATSRIDESSIRTASSLARIDPQTSARHDRCHNTTVMQTASSTVTPTRCQRPGSPLTHSTRSEEICERALMLSRLDGAHEADHRSRGAASR